MEVEVEVEVEVGGWWMCSNLADKSITLSLAAASNIIMVYLGRK